MGLRLSTPKRIAAGFIGLAVGLGILTTTTLTASAAEDATYKSPVCSGTDMKRSAIKDGTTPDGSWLRLSIYTYKGTTATDRVFCGSAEVANTRVRDIERIEVTLRPAGKTDEQVTASTKGSQNASTIWGGASLTNNTAIVELGYKIFSGGAEEGVGDDTFMNIPQSDFGKAANAPTAPVPAYICVRGKAGKYGISGAAKDDAVNGKSTGNCIKVNGKTQADADKARVEAQKKADKYTADYKKALETQAKTKAATATKPKASAASTKGSTSGSAGGSTGTAGGSGGGSKTYHYCVKGGTQLANGSKVPYGVVTTYDTSKYNAKYCFSGTGAATKAKQAAADLGKETGNCAKGSACADQYDGSTTGATAGAVAGAAAGTASSPAQFSCDGVMQTPKTRDEITRSAGAVLLRNGICYQDFTDTYVKGSTLHSADSLCKEDLARLNGVDSGKRYVISSACQQLSGNAWTGGYTYKLAYRQQAYARKI